MESFFQNPEDTKRKVRLHQAWEIVGCVNLDFLLLAEFPIWLRQQPVAGVANSLGHRGGSFSLLINRLMVKSPPPYDSS
jgi:hypothetical protein